MLASRDSAGVLCMHAMSVSMRPHFFPMPECGGYRLHSRGARVTRPPCRSSRRHARNGRSQAGTQPASYKQCESQALAQSDRACQSRTAPAARVPQQSAPSLRSAAAAAQGWQVVAVDQRQLEGARGQALLEVAVVELPPVGARLGHRQDVAAGASEGARQGGGEISDVLRPRVSPPSALTPPRPTL